MLYEVITVPQSGARAVRHEVDLELHSRGRFRVVSDRHDARRTHRDRVITSYSIHYTKLYEVPDGSEFTGAMKYLKSKIFMLSFHFEG